MADPVESGILAGVAAGALEDTRVFAAKLGVRDEDYESVVVKVVKRLEALNIVVAEVISKQLLVIVPACARYCEEGSPEAQVFRLVPSGAGVAQGELSQNALVKDSDGFRVCMANKWLKTEKGEGGAVTVVRIAERLPFDVDPVQAALCAVRDGKDISEADAAMLKKRKFIELKTLKSFRLTPGPKFTTERKKMIVDLTPELLASGEWETVDFKPYNFNALGKNEGGGHLHPLLKVRSAFRQVFLEMGFEEMPTNQFVESSFWNFDSLFQPQQHPARDAHDTFFVENAVPLSVPKDYLERVCEMHSSGDKDSIGWRYNWSKQEAEKCILRTHTTAVSSRMLYKLAQEGFKPKRYFSIDRVFRNEHPDATHLAEFHQIEGVVCDRGLSLADLMGVVQQFFHRIGLSPLRFKPAYNPYTEPSMEIFAYHAGLKKWVEVGNSGVFRPEMLKPMGLPDDVSCVAWGISLERPTMIRYGIDNIRSLVGHKVDVNMVRDSPIYSLGLQNI